MYFLEVGSCHWTPQSLDLGTFMALVYSTYSLLSTLLSCLAFDIRTSEQDTLFNTHRMAY